MADPTFRAAGTVAFANSGDISPALPAGTATGDILELLVIVGGTTATTVSGYTKKQTVTNGTAHILEHWWKRAGSSESAPTVTNTGGHDIRAVILGYFNCPDSGDPHADAQIQQNGSSATATSPAVTTTAANQLVTFFTGWTTTGAATPTCSGYSGSDPTFTEQVDSTGFGATENTALAVATGTKTSVGSTGSVTATWTSADFNSAGMFVLLGPGLILPTAGAQLDIERESDWKTQRWDFPLATDLDLDDFLPSAPASGTTVSVPLGTLTLTGFAPIVVNPKSVSVPLGTLTLIGFVPAVKTPRTAQVPLATLTLSGFAPTVIATANIRISVPIGTLTLTGFAPAVVASGGLAIAVPLATLSMTGFAPAIVVTANVRVSIPLAVLTLSGFAPSVLISGTPPAANSDYYVMLKRRRRGAFGRR